VNQRVKLPFGLYQGQSGLLTGFWHADWRSTRGASDESSVSHVWIVGGRFGESSLWYTSRGSAHNSPFDPASCLVDAFHAKRLSESARLGMFTESMTAPPKPNRLCIVGLWHTCLESGFQVVIKPSALRVVPLDTPQ